MSLADEVERGRAATARQAWAEAYAALSAAAEQGPLEPWDLLRLAQAASLSGRDEGTDLLARAYQAFIDHDDLASAARCAVWLGMQLQYLGEPIRGRGWIARARRLADEVQRAADERGEGQPAGAEQGYVLVPLARQMADDGDLASAQATFEQAQQIGQRCRDADLLALAQLGLGSCRVRQGQAANGLAELDEVMIALEAREVSPIVTGILYCAVINLCHEVYDLRRAQEWTVALTRWCAAHPDMVPFRGQCQVHRAQVLQLHGDWPAAMDIAERVADEHAPRAAVPAIGPAWYQKAELHRLRGELERAEAAYREASRWGAVPEPGLALLRLAQGQTDAARVTIARALDEALPGPLRARLLPTGVEIMLTAGEVAAAQQAADELAALAEASATPFLQACAAHAVGAVRLAEGEARAALLALRQACDAWQQLDAPYEAARTRELLGLACRALGDEDGARLELDAAAWTFRQLGAAPDLARVEGLARLPAAAPEKTAGGLTGRELEVLRLLAAGKSNRAIATELVLSEKTVARHVSNIFTKLGLGSRSAATAYAYEHQLV